MTMENRNVLLEESCVLLAYQDSSSIKRDLAYSNATFREARTYEEAP